MHVIWVLVGATLLFSRPVQGHQGDRLIPIFEITDSMLEQVDFEDGSVDEWEDFSEATLTTLDFAERFDPAEFDFRMWLGWNATRQRIYLSILAADDLLLDSPSSRTNGDP